MSFLHVDGPKPFQSHHPNAFLKSFKKPPPFLVHAASNATSRFLSPTSSTTFPRSHSLASPSLVHLTSSAPFSFPLSAHFLISSSPNPAARSLSAPFCFQISLSRKASSAMSQSSFSSSGSESV